MLYCGTTRYVGTIFTGKPQNSCCDWLTVTRTSVSLVEYCRLGDVLCDFHHYRTSGRLRLVYAVCVTCLDNGLVYCTQTVPARLFVISRICHCLLRHTSGIWIILSIFISGYFTRMPVILTLLVHTY
jgi:hypothetical protein